MMTHPTGLFRETIFRPLGVLAPQIFTRPTSTSPINCISSRTWVAGRPQVGLCPIFLVYYSLSPSLFSVHCQSVSTVRSVWRSVWVVSCVWAVILFCTELYLLLLQCLSGVQGSLLWNNNWVTFLDTMFHVQILAKSGTKTKLVTRISSIRIDPIEHEKFITTLEDGTKGLMPVSEIGLFTETI